MLSAPDKNVKVLSAASIDGNQRRTQNPKGALQGKQLYS